MQVAQEVHCLSCTMKVHGGALGRYTCHYIKASAQDLKATVSQKGIWREKKGGGNKGGKVVRRGYLWDYPYFLSTFLVHCKSVEIYTEFHNLFRVIQNPIGFTQITM